MRKDKAFKLFSAQLPLAVSMNPVMMDYIEQAYQAGKDSSKRNKQETDECFLEVKLMWLKAFPDFAAGFNGVGGSKINNIIKQTRNWIRAKPENNEDTKGHVIAMIQYVIAYVLTNNHWLRGKDLTTWDSKYLEVVYEIKNGKRNTTQSTRSFVDSL